VLSEDEVQRLASMSLWDQLDELIANGRVVIDRPRGRPHPKVAEYVYPLDYGYVLDSDGGDGEGLDVWVGSDTRRKVTAVFCTVDLAKRNTEVKVAWSCSDTKIDVIQAFYDPQPQAVITVRRDPMHEQAADDT
jgi:inorganic pyrophosphatase